jgi:glycosyltransferase involved in cell wall biosynthesis
MYGKHKVIVVMPGHNVERTLKRTYDEVMAQKIVDKVILVDDGSTDRTAAIGKTLKSVQVISHPKNRGYGAAQKTGYNAALKAGGDIVIMVHPDYQYTPKLIPPLTALLATGLYDCALGSRIIGGHPLSGGMPPWRYVSNRLLTFFENVMMGSKLSEFHSGYRAFTRKLLQTVPYNRCSDDFVFDNQMLAQILWSGLNIGEVTCPTLYFEEASSMSIKKSVKYGVGCVETALTYRLAKLGLAGSSLYSR